LDKILSGLTTEVRIDRGKIEAALMCGIPDFLQQTSGDGVCNGRFSGRQKSVHFLK